MLLIVSYPFPLTLSLGGVRILAQNPLASTVGSPVIGFLRAGPYLRGEGLALGEGESGVSSPKTVDLRLSLTRRGVTCAGPKRRDWVSSCLLPLRLPGRDPVGDGVPDEPPKLKAPSTAKPYPFPFEDRAVGV